MLRHQRRHRGAIPAPSPTDGQLRQRAPEALGDGRQVLQLHLLLPAFLAYDLLFQPLVALEIKHIAMESLRR